MKLQISFDMIDLNEAISIAKRVGPYADVLEIGTLLLLAHGITALHTFRDAFGNKTILTDTKIVDRGKEAALLFTPQTDWITIMSGTDKEVIHSAATTAHAGNKKVMLDLIDSREFGQTALEAKKLGADALLLHQPYDAEEPFVFLDKWDMLRGNTDLPIFMSGRITRDNIQDILRVKPDGIVLGRTILEAEDPEAEAKYFSEMCKSVQK